MIFENMSLSLDLPKILSREARYSGETLRSTPLTIGSSSSRRSSKSQWTSTAASTPVNEIDWPSAPNLYVETEDGDLGDVNQTLDLQLTQKTIEMLALMRGTTPDKMSGLAGYDPLSLVPRGCEQRFEDEEVTDETVLDDLIFSADDLAAAEGDDDYLVGEDFGDDFDAMRVSPLSDEQDDVEEDIFGMEL